jgi:ABC-type multidrug transport system ATPase subunit
VDPLFRVESAVKSYGRTPVLKSASIWARPGRITALLGRNGSGKSTLLAIGAGVIRPDDGAVHFAGRCHLRPRLHRLATEGLFYLPQRDLLCRRWTVGQHLAALAWRYGCGARERDVLVRLGIGERKGQRSDRLSGGERRRSELALAWIREPRCLLADEPFAGLDPRDVEVVAGALREMAGGGCALVVTGHEVRQLLDIADDVVWMVAGTTHGLGTREEALRSDAFRRGYLGPSGMV